MSTGGMTVRRRAEARIGRVLRDKWRLDAVIGVGGLGAVYAATHRAGKRVAIKILHPELSAHDEIRSRFAREAHVANRIGHPGVVSVSDDDVTDEGDPFLVMDLLEGETLDTRRKRFGGKLDPSEVLSFGDEVLDVLATAHGKGILHRDLKPENLFLTREGRLVVLDFGIARLNDPLSGDNATRTGMVMGTPAFMPPEQARGRKELVDARSDLWALGATMFALLAGRLVHGSLTANEALAATITTPAPPLRSVAPEVPEPVALVVDRALAFEPAMRWPDARTMQDAVREALAAVVASGTTTMPLTHPPVLAEVTVQGTRGPETVAMPPTGAPVSTTEAHRRPEKRAVAPIVAIVVGAVLLGVVAVLLLVRGRGGTAVSAAQASSDPGVTPPTIRPPESDPGLASASAEAPAPAPSGDAAEPPPVETAKPVIKTPVIARTSAASAVQPSSKPTGARDAPSDPFAKRTRAPNR